MQISLFLSPNCHARSCFCDFVCMFPSTWNGFLPSLPATPCSKGQLSPQLRDASPHARAGVARDVLARHSVFINTEALTVYCSSLVVWLLFWLCGKFPKGKTRCYVTFLIRFQILPLPPSFLVFLALPSPPS